MPARYTLRTQFGLHQRPEDILPGLMDLCRHGRIDEVMLFLFAEEYNNGHETLAEIEAWLAWTRPVQKALRDAGLRLSVNPWHSLLHVDRGRTLKPDQPWQTMQDQHGRACTAVVCPLDPAWRAYYAQSLARYAAEDFEVIWIDDDIRYHNHGDLDWGGCFCPLHIAAFNQHTGLAVSRAELVRACTAPGIPHPWRAQWLDLWESQHLELIASWRDLVEAHGKRLGLMSSLPEQHGAEGRRWGDWWKALSSGPVWHRPHFWPYAETTAPALTLALNTLDQNRSIQPPGVESGPEIECIPYGQWNKPFRQIAAQLVAAQAFGSTHLQLSLYDHMGNDPADEPARADFLHDWKPTLNWLADLFHPSLRTHGVSLPWSEDMGRNLHTKKGGAWSELVCPGRGWAGWLGAAGVATSVHAEGAVVALAGPGVRSFSDAALKEWLARGVLLDGEAARILDERGFSAYTGLSDIRTITQQDVVYATECCTHPLFTRRPGAQLSVNSEFFTAFGQHLIQGTLAPSTLEITELRGPRQERCGHGALAYANTLGGRVAIMPWNADTLPCMNTLRADQLARILAWLDPSLRHGRAEGGAWLVPLVLADAQRWRVVIWNAGGDAVEAITWHAPRDLGSPDEAWLIEASGKRWPVKTDAARLILPQPLHQWECVVLAGRRA